MPEPATQTELPLSMTSDANSAPPPAEQVVAEARRKFVLPPEGEETPAGTKPAAETPARSIPEDKGTPGEAKPENEAASPDAKQGGSEAEQPPKKDETPEQAEKRREARRFERRLEKARRQAIEHQVRAEAAERRAQEAEARLQPKADTAGMPKLEDFDFDAERHATAVREWATKNARQQFEREAQESFVRQNENRLRATWEERVSKVEDRYEDFDSVVGEITPNNPVSIALMESELGAHVAYYLAKNPSVFEKISKMNPIAQVHAIGRLEATVEQQLSAKPPTPSKAPEPIAPVQTNANPSSSQPSEQDDMGAWIRKRQKQVYGARVR